MKKSHPPARTPSPSRREFIGGFVIVVIVGGVLVSRSGGPRELSAQPIVTLQPTEPTPPQINPVSTARENTRSSAR